jgi:hypothetical protein
MKMSKKPISLHVSEETLAAIKEGMAKHNISRDQFIEDSIKHYINIETEIISTTERKIQLIDAILRKQPYNPFAAKLNGIKVNTLEMGNNTTDLQDKVINNTYKAVFGYYPISIIQKEYADIPTVSEVVPYLEYCINERLPKQIRQDPTAQYDEARADLDCTYSYTPPGRMFLENRLETIKKRNAVTPKIWNEICKCEHLPITYDDYRMEMNEKATDTLFNKYKRCEEYYKNTMNIDAIKDLNDAVLEIKNKMNKYKEENPKTKYIPISEYAEQAKVIDNYYCDIIYRQYIKDKNQF